MGVAERSSGPDRPAHDHLQDGEISLHLTDHIRAYVDSLLARRGVTFQRTKTWKESPDLERDAKLDRTEEVLERLADRA